LADTNTTRYGYVKPEVGASADTWGTKINQVFDDIDVMGGAITTTGSANAYVLTTGLSLNSSPAAYVAGQMFAIKANFSNTGAATINVDTLGAKNLTKNGTTALASGDMVSGNIYFIAYDGTQFQVLGSIGAGAQPLDATLTALAALSYTSGTLVLTLTASDVFTLTAVGTSGATFPLLSTANTWTTTQTMPKPVVSSGGAWTTSSIGKGLEIPKDIAVWWPKGADTYAFGTRASGNSWRVDYSTADDNSAATNAAIALSIGAGTYQVAGVEIRRAGKTSIPIPASGMVANTTNGPSSGTQESATNKVMTRTLDFDTTTQEGAQFLIPMPKSWNESTVTFQACWTAASGSGGVVWELRGVALSDDDAIDTAFGTGQTSTDTLITALDVHWSPESSAITIAGSPADNDLVIFQIRRNVADGSDTLGVDAKLIAIRLFITTSAGNDA